MKAWQIPAAEELLKSQERWCMNACGKFLDRDSLKGQVWVMDNKRKQICALVVYARQTLLPVLCGQPIASPHFLRHLLGMSPVHSLQGMKEDVENMEYALRKIRLYAIQSIDYDMMCIDSVPSDFRAAGPAGLIIRKPVPDDLDAFAALHAAYEQEEVLPAASAFNPVASRFNAERIFAKEHTLVAEIGGNLIGKINTNAIAFTRLQLGGVYVHPLYRDMGIARRMTGEFVANLVDKGMGISLFVKKSNDPARRVYQRIGFTSSGDYRVSYY